MEEFNIIDYVSDLHKSLKTTTSFEFCRVSDPKAMEEVIQSSKRTTRFFAVDDSQDGMIYRGEGGGWFERRPVVIFLLGTLEKWPDMFGRHLILKEMRSIYHKLVARLLHDSEHYEALTYLNDEIPYDEVPGMFAGGTAGLFFTFTVDIPVNLEYDESDWE